MDVGGRMAIVGCHDDAGFPSRAITGVDGGGVLATCISILNTNVTWTAGIYSHVRKEGRHFERIASDNIECIHFNDFAGMGRRISCPKNGIHFSEPNGNQRNRTAEGMGFVRKWQWQSSYYSVAKSRYAAGPRPAVSCRSSHSVNVRRLRSPSVIGDVQETAAGRQTSANLVSLPR